MLHIGPHHALSNRDLLQLLHCTSKLQELDLFYDNFLNVQLVSLLVYPCITMLTQLSS